MKLPDRISLSVPQTGVGGLWFASVFLGMGSVVSSKEPGRVDFNRDIRPILSEHCYHCHGPDAETRDADLRLDIEAEAKKDLGGYFALVPGKPEESEIWLRVDHDDPDEVMPPPKAKRDLTPEKKELFRRWIAEGAAYEKHWAYEKPVRAELLPSVKAQVKNEIDRFVFAKLESEGLAPSPEAAPETLLRRASLDLTGLPPSPEELDRFLSEWKSDPEAAYTGAVGLLLKSERFGERWARPWLDLARYADSNGFQADQLRDSWAYRDWVIGALNQNMPFDRFTIEQLAGDLLPDATVEQKIATGFHRTVTCNVEAGVHPEENRVNQVVDRVNTTGTVWLGSTIECAQCHDHKYDPFSMADYYSIFAYFNNTPVEVENPSGKGVSFDFYGPKMELPLDAAKQTERASLTAKLDELRGRQKTLAAANEKDRAEWESRLVASAAKAPVWETLEIEDFSGTGGETCERLEDGSLLVKGELPKQTTYTVKAWTKVNGIRAVKIEALTHESLPDQGPGRGDRPNIIVNEVRLAAATGGGKDEPVALHGAEADFSQNNWNVGGAIDGDPRTGWAINPEFGKDHWMTVRTGGPIPSDENGTLLTLALDQNYGGGRTIGRLRISVTADEPAAPDLPEDLTAILKKPAGKRSAKDKKTLDEQFAKANPKLLALNREIAGVEKALKAVEPDTTLVMVEMDESRETHVMTRGNYLAPAEKVGSRTPAALHPLDPALPKNRLGFAKWLMDRENPLVARVTVNRWWNEIFGHGLVGTLEDFGAQGDPPSHPELLDWLAMEFMDSGWDMKHVLRLMVTSAVYRQSSRVTPELLEKDPANVLYARGPRFRMSAEMIRDNGLAVAGLLSTRMGGKPIMPYQPPGLWRQIGRNEPVWVDAKSDDRFRRGIYVVYRRAAPYPSFVNFDAPDRGSCVVKRGRTNTPLQALTLLNDPAYLEMALGFADRVLTSEPSADFGRRLDLAYRVALQRTPSDAERKQLEAVYNERLSALDEKAALDLLAEPLAVVKAGFTGDRRELAAWFFLSNILLNLDETITKS